MTQNNDPFGFSLNLDATPKTPSVGEAKRWLAPPFRAHAINAEAVLVQVSGQYPAQRLNVQLVQILSLCNALRTDQGHLSHITQALGLSSQHTEAIKEALEHLKAKHLLVAEEDILAALATSKTPSPTLPQISHCFIRTADRPEALAELLPSMQAHLGESNQLNVWILDDSKEPQNVKQNQKSAETFANDWPGQVFHIDIERRRALMAHIAKSSGAKASSLEWLIEGDPKDPQPTYGASFNTALLLAAGQRFCMLDDDANLAPFGLEERQNTLHIRPDRKQKTVFMDPERAEFSQFPKVSIDAVGQHAHWLGQPLSSIVAQSSPQHPELLDHIDAQTLHDLQDQPTVRLTTNGTLGDPGTTTPAWLFSQPASDLNAICNQDPEWQQRLFNRRFARSSTGTQVTTDFALMTTTLTGIDNRVLLLPTIAKGRNEDLLFGVLLHFLHPNALSVQLPFMLPHRVDEKRPWTLDALQAQPNLHKRHGFLRFLCDWIEALDVPPGHHLTRLSYLKAWLEHLASSDPSMLSTKMMDHIGELQADQLKYISETASELDPPEWLRALFDQVIEQVSAVDEQAQTHLQMLIDELQGFARAYAQAIDDWTVAWRWCCQHDMVTELP